MEGFFMQRTDDYDIVLTKEEPYERLEELCTTQSPFVYSYSWSKFRNGYFMKCTLRLKTGGKVGVAYHFVPEEDINRAKNIIASKLLYNVGLSPLEFEPSSNGGTQNDVDDMLESVLAEIPAIPQFSQSSQSSQSTSNPLLDAISQHLTPEQLSQFSGVLAPALDTFSSFDETKQQTALGFLNSFMGQMPSSSSKKTEEISDLE